MVFSVLFKGIISFVGQKIWFLICFVFQGVEQDAKNRI